MIVIRVTGSQPAFLKPDRKVFLGNPVSPSPRNSREIAPVPSQSGSKSLDFNPPPTVATVPDLISTRGLDPGLFPGVEQFPGLKSEMTPVATLTPQPDGAKNKSTAQKSQPPLAESYNMEWFTTTNSRIRKLNALISTTKPGPSQVVLLDERNQLTTLYTKHVTPEIVRMYGLRRLP